jgi:peptidoglycan/xylan/chitin deacetylase (PgdA/CDA1 family)
MIGPLLRMVAGEGARARLSILIFHRVLDTKDELFPEIPDVAEFRQTMQWVRDWFHVLALDEAVDRLRQHSLPPAALAITFDDGYADNARNAAPIMAAAGLTATFFVCSGVLDGGRMWNDSVIEALRAAPEGVLDLHSAELGTLDLTTTAKRRAAIDFVLGALKHRPQEERDERVAALVDTVGRRLPTDLMMRSEQVRELSSGGMSIGAHSVSHPILARLPPDRARCEIADSREALQGLTGKRISLFAYPNGVPGVDYTDEHVSMVRDLGFAAACSTAWGVATASSDMMQLPRFTPWDKTPLRFGMRMMGNLRRTEAAVAA